MESTLFLSWLLLFTFVVLVLAAWLLAIGLFVGVAKMKGYQDLGGMIWFIGIFATPIVVGIYVAALPDRGTRLADSSTSQDSARAKSARSPQGELPAI